MKKRLVVAVSIILTFFFINFAFAESISEDLHLNIQTTFTNGTINVGTFAFVFNISRNVVLLVQMLFTLILQL
ncbi:MAG: hypothetical protein NTZ83_04175 [Candidatus Pacearchaeota archaeon]|nr:hypothetical protein [Candidatus Pacearchaeota archaeon]